MNRVDIPIYLPSSLFKLLRRLKHALPRPKEIRLNLLGDRDVEWSFVAAHTPRGRGNALDFGSGGTFLSLVAAERGYQVTALDLLPQKTAWRHPGVQFVQGDLLQIQLPQSYFDLVLNCSSVEHVGLSGRFGVTQSLPDGDLQAMACLRVLMKAGATMLLTVPCGRDACFVPFHRVYGHERLPRLLSGFTVEMESFWIKDQQNCWVACEKDAALSFEAQADPRDPFWSVYGLACMVLRTRRDIG